MNRSSEFQRQRTRRLLVLALLLLAQILGLTEPHAEHALSASLEDHGGRVLESACHPRDAFHLEAAGDGRHAHPCAACLHLLRSLGTERSPAPRLAPPEASLSLASLAGSFRSAEIPSSAAPRGPPAFA